MSNQADGTIIIPPMPSNKYFDSLSIRNFLDVAQNSGSIRFPGLKVLFVVDDVSGLIIPPSTW